MVKTAFVRAAGLVFGMVALFGAAFATDPVDLRVEKGIWGAVDLSWSGGAPDFEVFRSQDPANVVSAPNRFAKLQSFSISDSPVGGEVWFYQVRSKANCIRPLADARVSESNPTTNYGTSPELRANDLAGREWSFLKFSVDSIPEGVNIVSASLHLQMTQANSTGDTDIYASKSNWTETGLTWNNQPGTDGLYSQLQQVGGTGVRTWDLTQLVDAWHTDFLPNYGLVLSTPNAIGAVYHSRENTEELVPRLCIEWSDPQLDAVNEVVGDSQSPATVRLEDGTAATVDAELYYQTGDPVTSALAYLDDNPGLFGLNDVDAELYLDRVQARDEITTVTFGRRHQNIPVLDERILVLTDGVRVDGSSSSLRANRIYLGTAQLGAGEAAQAAADSIQIDHSDVSTYGQPSLVWVPEEIGDDVVRLAWRVGTLGKQLSTGVFTYYALYIDAEFGDELLRVDTSSTAGDRPGEAFATLNANNEGSDTCFLLPWEYKDVWHNEEGPTDDWPGEPEDFASDSEFTTNFTHDAYHYFFDNFAWGGMDGRSGGFLSYVHWNAPGFDNARFTPVCNMLTYGDGWGTQDIVGHEFTHGVAFNTIPLWFTHAPGAINEHLADVFGSDIDGNWTIGDGRRDGGVDLDGDGNPDPTWISRWMADPTIRSHPDHISGYQDLPFDNDSGGVHSNNGILNKAAYMLTDGDIHNGISTSGIGREKARQLFFEVMVSQLQTFSNFSHMRDEMVRGAQRFEREGRFGFSINDVCDVINAYASVGIGNPDSDCDGVPNDPADDGDGDRIPDATDNCPLDPNVTQRDRDGDGLGDICDADIDGDGVTNDVDNCPTVVNAPEPGSMQLDTDLDGVGDLCDDDDSDTILDINDNCPSVPNFNQVDQDGDGVGNACDQDIDGDGSGNSFDNCPLVPNEEQWNSDGDMHGNECDNCRFNSNNDQSDIDGDDLGDVCDPDRDGDGIDNSVDNCPDDANTQQLDFDSDGVGTICDQSERTFWNGLGAAQQVSFFFEHLDVLEAIRVPLFPCTDGSCPPNFSAGMTTTIDFDGMSMSYLMKIVDDQGFVKAMDVIDDGALSLSFEVDHEYFYDDGQGGAPFQGRQYFLEMYAPPESVNGQAVNVLIDVQSYQN